jgi:hypothetical protein
MVSIVRAFLAIMPERHDVQRRFLPLSERAAAETWLMEHHAIAEANVMRN